MSDTEYPLPDDLPEPEDDGAADHLLGMALPSVRLPATDGSTVDLAARSGRSVVYCYPMTGRPDQNVVPDGWDEIPGARGCTPESCGFRDHHDELQSVGANAVFGLSVQVSDYQREARDRLELPFELLSDAEFAFAEALELPTFTVDGNRYLQRLTLVVKNGTVEHAFYPVFPPDQHAGEVADWLAKNVD
ncbi:peroxiredoxin [Halosegnis sp.]|uniref:peroxiredoxin n=1 Tax=Halosegnis sp. TaxID=2864959 RepID=UPI0035D4FB2A